MEKWYQRRVVSGDLLSSVVAVAKDGKLVHLQATGFLDRVRATPMRTDAIVWIGFLTEPVTAAAALALVEDGKLELDAPVERYLPEFKNMQVRVGASEGSATGTDAKLEPQARVMTIRDLLRHTDGTTYRPLDSTAPEALSNAQAGYYQDESRHEFIAEIAKLPLTHQPGRSSTFNLSYDVLANVIEVASGQPFDQFVQDRVLKPLRMIDTDFKVPLAKFERFAEPARSGPHPFLMGRSRRFISGSRGLASTAADLLRFCKMLLNGGELDGARVLSPQSVQLMTSNTLPADVQFYGNLWGGTGYGFGLQIRLDPESSSVPGAVGSFAGLGGLGTLFWVDPQQHLIAVHLNQAANEKVGMVDARNLTYGSLSAPPQAIAITPTVPVPGKHGNLSDYAGRYDFGLSPNPADKIARSLNNVGGIGVVVPSDSVSVPTVANVRGGSPAARAGLMKGDQIIQIDDNPTSGLSSYQVAERIRGPVGSRVRLKFLRKDQDEPIKLTITREHLYLRANELTFAVDGDTLVAIANGPWPFLDFENGNFVKLSAAADQEFYVPDGDHTRITFARDTNGKVTGAILNSGAFEQKGVLLPADVLESFP